MIYGRANHTNVGDLQHMRICSKKLGFTFFACEVVLLAFVFGLGVLVAQEAARRGSKVEIDNAHVHVLRNKHAAHEKVPMHSHKDAVVVYLTDVHERSTEADGTSREVTHRAGDVVWSLAHAHSLENLSDKPIEVIEIEIKDTAPQVR